MLMVVLSRFRGFFHVALLVAVVASAVPAFANTSFSTRALDRMVDSDAIVAAFAGSLSARIPVIIEFTSPEIAGASTRMDAAAADSARAEAMHRAQDAILGRVLNLPDQAGIAAATANAELNIKRMDFTPQLAITVDAALLERLAEDPSVVGVHLDRLSAPLLTSSLPLIGMPAAFSGGATGTGWNVAVLDTGGRRSHEFLAGQVVSAACYSSNDSFYGATSLCPGGVEQSTAIGSADDCNSTTIDGCGHGTHVAGIAAGFNATPSGGNPSSGVARDARIISINVFSQFPRSQCGSLPSQYTGGCVLSFDSDQLLGLQRVYALRNTMSIASVNMSLGGGGSSTACDGNVLKPIIDQLRAAGIATVIAAGNAGRLNTVSSPACISSAVAVASSTSSDQRSSFSDWGNLIDLVAPGSFILSSVVAGSSNNSYESWSGTSMAAPHVAGAFAALRSAVPGASVSQILSALQATGTPVTANGITRYRINVDQALSTLRGTSSTTTTLAGPASSTQGSPVTFTATVSATTGGTPTGTVTFRRDGTSIGTATLSGGSASLTTSSLPLGTHSITAAYGGSGTHSSSVSAARSHTVTAVDVPANDNFANRIAIPGSGTVTGSNVGATAESGEPQHGATTGTRNSVWWSYTPSSSGQVTIDTAGSNFDTTLAVYTGNAVNALTLVMANDDAIGLQSRVQFNAQAGVSYAIAVAGYGTATGSIVLNLAGQSGGIPTLTTLSGPTSSVFGQAVTLTAAVSSSTGAPEGTVSFRRGATVIGAATLSGGSASLTISGLPAGSHTLSAAFNGSDTHAASTSATLSHTVSQATVSVTLSAPSGPVRPGARVRLGASVQPVAPGGGIPAGSVSFRSGSRTLGTAPLSGGSTELLVELPTGANTITARFDGSGNHAAGVSAAQQVIVTAAMGDEMMANRRLSFIQRRPALASLRQGAVVVFEDQHTAGGPFGITAQQLDSTGIPTGPAIEVSRPQNQTGRPHVAQLEGGAIVVVWQAQGSAATDIFMRRFRSTDGRPFGPATEINGVTRGVQAAPRIAALQDGGFVVVWQSQNIDGNGLGIAIRFFDNTGAPRGPQMTVNTTTRGNQRNPDVTVLSNGDVVVVWGGPMASGFGAFAQRLTSDGVLLGGEIEVGSSGSGLTPQAFVTALGSGNFAIAYESSDRPNMWGPIRNVVQRMRPGGRHWGGEVRMERVIDGAQRMPAIAALRQMGLVTAWRAPDSQRQGIWIQAMGRNGVPIGSPERANQTLAGNQREPSVARLGSGRSFVVAWTAPGSGSDDGANIVVRRFLGP